MSEDNYWTGAFVRPLTRIGRIIGIAVTVAILPAILIYVFCFSMKTTSEYRCALQVMKEDARVLASTGAPIQPGWIAWTKYYESGGMLTQGMFVTYVSGPDGGGRRLVLRLSGAGASAEAADRTQSNQGRQDSEDDAAGEAGPPFSHGADAGTV